MFDFHKDVVRYFNIQQEVTTTHIIPFISQVLDLSANRNVMEVGCGEAGVLKAFLDHGHKGVGIELSETRAEKARAFLDQEIKEGMVEILNRNIYELDPDTFQKFDLIILKDVIEHIPDQDRFIPFIHKFLTKDGVIFFGFPPWYMPFGGHQQISRNKWLSKIPWIHLLPKKLYLWVYSRLSGDPTWVAKELGEIKDTGISIDRMYRIFAQNKYKILLQKYWFINPIYTYKFNLKPRVISGILTKIPFVRNFYTTALYIIFR